jgi:NAD(P)-dependent dehydrogenase (short-subunit alcohol dehydrogenase family)
MKLAGKVVLVTGSSNEIGRALAARFAQEGADVVINYNRTPDGAQEALGEVEAALSMADSRGIMRNTEPEGTDADILCEYRAVFQSFVRRNQEKSDSIKSDVGEG